MVSKSASSTTIVQTFRSPGFCDVSANEEASRVAKYSDRRLRMSEWAYITRFLARGEEECDDVVEDGE